VEGEQRRSLVKNFLQTESSFVIESVTKPSPVVVTSARTLAVLRMTIMSVSVHVERDYPVGNTSVKKSVIQVTVRLAGMFRGRKLLVTVDKVVFFLQYLVGLLFLPAIILVLEVIPVAIQFPILATTRRSALLVRIQLLRHALVDINSCLMYCAVRLESAVGNLVKGKCLVIVMNARDLVTKDLVAHASIHVVRQ